MSKLFGIVKGKCTLMCLAVFAMCLTMNSVFADLVEIDSGTGAVVFNPGEVVSPIQSAIIATILATVSIVVIIVGMKWLYKLVKGH